VKNTNRHFKLVRRPSFKWLVGFEGLILHVKKVQMGKSGVVIDECNVVTSSSFCLNRSRSLEVRMDLFAKFLGTLALMSLRDGLPCSLSIDT